MENEYQIIGKIKYVDGQLWVNPEYLTDGITYGVVYKNYKAYFDNWDEVCYVPEHGYQKDSKDKDGYYHECDGYTHNDLLALCGYNREFCDYLFDNLMWAYPETHLVEWDDSNLLSFYNFIRPGVEVWWNDPDGGQSSGVFTVIESPFQWGEYGEPLNDDEVDLGSVVLIGNDYSEAEVPAHELTPVYLDLIDLSNN